MVPTPVFLLTAFTVSRLERIYYPGKQRSSWRTGSPKPSSMRIFCCRGSSGRVEVEGVDTLSISLIVRPESRRPSTAPQAVAVPEVRAVRQVGSGSARLVRASLTRWLASAKLVRVDIPDAGRGQPVGWKGFGQSANDPDFEDYLQEIQRARQTGASARLRIEDSS